MSTLILPSWLRLPFIAPPRREHRRFVSQPMAMAHLKKSGSSGHLLKTAGGHLVNDCGGSTVSCSFCDGGLGPGEFDVTFSGLTDGTCSGGAAILNTTFACLP